MILFKIRLFPITALLFLSILFFAGCSGNNPDNADTAGGGDDTALRSIATGDISAEETAEDETGYRGQYLGPDYLGGFTHEDNSYNGDGLTDGENFGETGDEDADISYNNFKNGVIAGQTNSNGMYSLWKAERMIANYFYSGNAEDESGRYLSDSLNVYYYFDEDNSFRIFRFDSAGPYYLNTGYSCLYSYNKISNQILMGGIEKGGFYPDGDRAVFAYFSLIDGIWYCRELSKLKSIDGEIKSVTDEEFKVKMWLYYTKEELSLGDGKSKGSIDLTIDYKGKKIINERSPIVAIIKNADDEKFTPVSGNAVTSKIENKINIKGIPDGRYLLYIIRINDILKSYDPEPGDIYTIYDHTFYGGPAPAVIPVENGSYHALLVDFDDSHALPAEIKGTPLTILSGVDCRLNEGMLTVSVNIDAGQFTGNPLVSAFCYAPSACAYNQARFDSGQKIEIALERKENSTIWAGETRLENYNESGVWKIGMIQLEGVINGKSRHIGYSMADEGNRIRDNYIYYDWTGGDAGTKRSTAVRVKTFDFRSKNSDITAPGLIAIDKAEKPGGRIEFSVTVENSGSSGHRLQDFAMDQFPVQMFLFHREVPPVNIDDAYAVEFRDVPEINGDYAVCTAAVDIADLPGYGDWDVKAIQLIDFAGNNSFYFIYNDDIYSGIFNFWGNAGTYSLYNFGPELPAQTGLEMISVEKNPEPDIYISGYYNADSKFSRFPDDEQIPCVWKNGAMRVLGRSYKIFAYPASIFVDDDNIYAAGYAYSESDPMIRGSAADPVACMWKNDIMIYLDENLYGKANSVSVAGKTVYAAGYYRNGSGRYAACLWIYDGKSVSRKDIMSGSIKDDFPSQATSVFASSEAVYIAGSITDGAESFSYLWKYNPGSGQFETTKLGLDGFNDIRANSIFISDNNIFMTADYKDHEQLKTIVGLWINNSRTVISGEPDVRARSVYVSDGTAYICGDYAGLKTKRVAALWETGESGVVETILFPEGSGRASSVFVSLGEAYVAGSHDTNNKSKVVNRACYWKNGELIDLSGFGTHNSEASSVYIHIK